MKTFTAEDEYIIPGRRMFLIRRADPYAPLGKDELPKPSERVMVDGAEHTVLSAEGTGDSEFKWIPHLVVAVAPPPA